jgi:hypothetical protein
MSAGSACQGQDTGGQRQTDLVHACCSFLVTSYT